MLGLSAATREERLSPELRRLMAILIAGVLAVFLDTTVVNVAINTLSRQLHALVTTIQWVSTIYLLALGMVVPISGWASTRFGAKNMWLLALSLVLLGSVLCGLAPSVGALIAFRTLQGAGGGLLIPIEQTLIIQAAGGRNIGRVLALIGLPVVVVPVLGPVIGGLITSELS